MNRVRTRIHLEEVVEATKENIPFSIAVLDSGICNHPDLIGSCVAFRDFVNERVNPYDDSGHGTHVCGILCGSGVLSEGKYRGVCPAAHLVVGKVLDAKGEGQAAHMLQGMEWVLKNKEDYNIRLLNISVGIGGLKDKQKAEKLKEMTEKLWDAGIVVVCAAGNKGPADDSISAIGGLGKVITVGCYDDMGKSNNKESCERYSGRGKRSGYPRKPDLVAPGSEIISCSREYDKVTKQFERGYTAKSGTSMATPIVTGCAALLMQKVPAFTNEDIREHLHYTAEDLKKPWNFQGWGMIHAKNLLEIL